MGRPRRPGSRISLRRGLTLLAVAASLGAIAVVGLQPRASSTPRVAPALPASVIVAPRVTVSSLRGKPALVNFWASWCDPCRREAPAVEDLARTLPRGTRLVGVDWNDTASGATDFIRRFGWTFPNLRDGDGIVGNTYGVIGLPTTFVLDGRGHVVRVLRGPQSTSELRLALVRAQAH